MADEIDFDFGDQVDKATFAQILDMDEEEDRDFSKSIVFGFLEQADQTFDKMDAEIKAKNLDELSKLGHFLKGSSATLGFVKVRDECEKIQHYGHKKNETGEVDEPDEDKCLRLINDSLSKCKTAYNAVNELMKQYYAES
ncbi:Multistep phosphorelay regulator 1 [Cyphellophora attinorum]|uniref:Multistep phosphorelay regulator 1 n=1 Tax=Cyphellophora attinorum TaxID=1664694 RepID=A0A0N1H8I2_9EURO|nr:Multistep phosphorelay regulator 1 [Phialophora attinorum]KPI43242.1 Multistep phosphorelay regulator 1 [Phialophora attinorum]